MTLDAETRADWAEALGGLPSSEAAAARAGVSVANVRAAADAGHLIALIDRRGQVVYPGCQFKHGWPDPTLIAAWTIIASTAPSPWTACSWIASADDRLAGLSPLASAPSGSAPRLLDVARHDAALLEQ